jgi:hypothetical protein
MTAGVSVDRMSLAVALERLGDDMQPSTARLASRDTPSDTLWDLGADFIEARRLALLGWTQKVETMVRQIEVLRLSMDSSISDLFDVSGEAVEIGRFLANEPECMFAQQVTPELTVSILLNIVAVCDAQAQFLFNRGIAVAALVRALQSTGRSVSVSIGVAVAIDDHPSRNSQRHVTIVNIQDHGDLMSPGRLAFWLAHPAALRRCILRFNEQQPQETRQKFGFHMLGGYGVPCEIPRQCIPKDVVYIPFVSTEVLHSHYGSPERALQTLVRELNNKKDLLRVSV